MKSVIQLHRGKIKLIADFIVSEVQKIVWLSWLYYLNLLLHLIM
jgi:hypothetical protein